MNKENKFQMEQSFGLATKYIKNLHKRTLRKLKKFFKGILNCYKLQIAFISQNKLANAFRFKDRIPKELTSCAAYKFQRGLCNKLYHDECVIHLNVRTGQHIRILPLIKKKVKPRASAVSCQ